MIEVGARGVAGRIAHVDAHRRVEVLVVEERDECDAQRGIGDLDAVDGSARRRIAGILDVADDHARFHIVRRHAINHELRSAEVNVVVRRDDRDARPFQPDLDVAAGARLERAQTAHSGPAHGHDDFRCAGLQVGDRRLADFVRDPDLVASVLRDLSLARLVEAEERRLLAVLLEDDADRLHSGGVGAAMLTWSGVAVPTNFSGFSMVMAGGVIRPATIRRRPPRGGVSGQGRQILHPLI